MHDRELLVTNDEDGKKRDLASSGRTKFSI